MEGNAILRRLIGEIQDFAVVFGGSPPLDPSHSHVDDGFSDFFMGGKQDVNMVEECISLPRKRSQKEQRCERSLSFCISSEFMDQKIWKHFPEDLIEAVLARIPVATFFRFRLVCQRWNSLLTSNSFSQCCAEAPRKHPWFYTMTYEEVKCSAMFDPALQKLHHTYSPPLSNDVIILPATSAGGLVCLLDFWCKTFYVCNPLTRSSRELSRSDWDWSRVAVGMTLNGPTASSGYKLIWLDRSGQHEVYDSLEQTWSCCPGSSSLSLLFPLSLNIRSHTISLGSEVYFMCNNPDGVLSYDMVTCLWKRFAVPSPKHLTDHTLAEAGGQLLLVGLLSNSAATCVCIWELQKMTLLWKEVDRMPNIWCLEFYGKRVRMTCLGNRDLIMLSLWSRPGVIRHITYDVSKGEWNRVPESRLLGTRKGCMCGTAFHPSPTALA